MDFCHSISGGEGGRTSISSVRSGTDWTPDGEKNPLQNHLLLFSLEVKNTSYPRLDPTIIAAVISPDNSKLLLAKSRKFTQSSMYSCVAGFMEPGKYPLGGAVAVFSRGRCGSIH